MRLQGTTSLKGSLSLRVKRAKGPGLGWHLRNRLRFGYVYGWLSVQAAKLFSRLTGLPVVAGSLRLWVRRTSGEIIDYGVVCYRVVTTAGVGFLVDAFQNTVELEEMKYHGIGTGSTAENVADVGLDTELTTQYQTDNTRATGTTAEGATANIFRTEATNTVDGAVAIVEHGLFSDPDVGQGVLLDRSVFAVVNLNPGDSLTSRYELEFTAGG